MLTTVVLPGASYANLSPDEMLAFARGDSVNPASPLRYGLSFLSHPDLQRIYAAGARHLELGCGVGGNLLTLLNTYPLITAVGVELDAALLKVARQRAAELGVADRVEWRQGDARDIADEATFDTLAWSQYYFPAESRAATLAAAFRALKPGGYLLSSMLPAPPASEEERIGPAGRVYAITRLLYGSWGVPVRDEAELRAAVEAAGFTFVQFLESPQRRRLLARRSPA
jgi:SAM-dependent methyltransferase